MDCWATATAVAGATRYIADGSVDTVAPWLLVTTSESDSLAMASVDSLTPFDGETLTGDELGEGGTWWAGTGAFTTAGPIDVRLGMPVATAVPGLLVTTEPRRYTESSS